MYYPSCSLKQAKKNRETGEKERRKKVKNQARCKRKVVWEGILKDVVKKVVSTDRLKSERFMMRSLERKAENKIS
jgi:hypothetical protein